VREGQPVIDQARAWIETDPDEETSAALRELLDRARAHNPDATAALEELFSGHLSFGTAGLRGKLGPGPMRMNRVVVAHAARGLGRFLVDQNPGDTDLTVVIGFDARKNSDVFARDTQTTLSAMGIRALVFSRYVPTPVLAFAVRHLDAHAGVMVTASHNPPADNGYKVYLGKDHGGSQIVSPVDEEIHSRIRDSYSSPIDFLPAPLATANDIDEDVIQQYLEQTAVLAHYDSDSPLRVKLCYTPLHGVGSEVFLRLLDISGFPPPIVVSAQVAPDPTFPTVAFPNPEEPGALDLAIQTATKHDCDLIIAHDPDADRLAVALPDELEPSGWRILPGNDLGMLLMADLAERHAADNKAGTLACSLVSTPALAALADKTGHRFLATPTGFKWISRPRDLVGGFEEALGYLVNPGTVRDKDGISAGLALLALTHRLLAEGKTLIDRLDDLAVEYGGWASDAISLRFDHTSQVDRLMDAVRKNPPDVLGSAEVTGVVDYLTAPPEGFPPTNLLVIDISRGGRVIFRPSGTEPKIKCYIDAVAATRDEAHALVSLTASTISQGLSALTALEEGV